MKRNKWKWMAAGKQKESLALFLIDTTATLNYEKQTLKEYLEKEGWKFRIVNFNDRIDLNEIKLKLENESK